MIDPVALGAGDPAGVGPAATAAGPGAAGTTGQGQPSVPYGAWPSPITAAKLVEGAAGVSEIRVDGDDIWWNEQRPSEGGRYQLVRRSSAGHRHDLFPAWDPDSDAGAAWNARTAVMEYGGGAWGVRQGVVVFANWADQRLYRVDRGDDPTPISPEPPTIRGHRWSEPTWIDDRWLVCVRECHDPDVVAEHGEAVNELVAIPMDGSAAADPSLVRVLVTGPDFVHSPAVRGDQLAWLQWDHPHMPWDGTELVLATVERDDDGAPSGITAACPVAGGPAESVVQPGFTAHGDLVFCTDRTGWWNPWRATASALAASGHRAGSEAGERSGMVVEPVVAGGGVEAEIGGALWVGGLRWWTELDDGRLLVSRTADGSDALAVIGLDGCVDELATPFSEISQVVAGPGGSVLAVAGTPVSEGAPYAVHVTTGSEAAGGPQPGADRHGGGLSSDRGCLEQSCSPGSDPDSDNPAHGGNTAPSDRPPTVAVEQLRPSRDLGIGTEWFSRPDHVSFPSAGGRTAHALFYPPHNPGVAAPDGALPPLVVMVHGGPTSAARSRLELAKQFWTTRGFAVVDVNYGGSTGYGRPYRDLLQGAWGIVDVDDAVAAARYLADQGRVDPERLAIRGGSAGGYTTLAALCFHDVFRAGASHYGVADLAALATETHKFESRYLDGLVGPWPVAEATYAERSPIHHTDGFDTPLIVLQGSEDEVVPPNQAEMIVAALAAKGVPHAYLLFDGEQHGFRQAANIVRALEAELWFYGRVFAFTPADHIEPVDGAVGL